MNQKQLICMWCGITAIVLMGLSTMAKNGRYAAFVLWVFLVALVTGGLIYTFKDQGSKDQVQNIRGDILKKRQFNMRKNDQRQD